ncbi:hypothetical protein D3C72_1919340 [compost metagenome]
MIFFEPGRLGEGGVEVLPESILGLRIRQCHERAVQHRTGLESVYGVRVLELEQAVGEIRSEVTSNGHRLTRTLSGANRQLLDQLHLALLDQLRPAPLTMRADTVFKHGDLAL